MEPRYYKLARVDFQARDETTASEIAFDALSAGGFSCLTDLGWTQVDARGVPLVLDISAEEAHLRFATAPSFLLDLHPEILLPTPDGEPLGIRGTLFEKEVPGGRDVVRMFVVFDPSVDHATVFTLSEGTSRTQYEPEPGRMSEKINPTTSQSLRTLLLESGVHAVAGAAVDPSHPGISAAVGGLEPGAARIIEEARMDRIVQEVPPPQWLQQNIEGLAHGRAAGQAQLPGAAPSRPELADVSAERSAGPGGERTLLRTEADQRRQRLLREYHQSQHQ
jgi:hypothetical protein